MLKVRIKIFESILVRPNIIIHTDNVMISDLYFVEFLNVIFLYLDLLYNVILIFFIRYLLQQLIYKMHVSMATSSIHPSLSHSMVTHNWSNDTMNYTWDIFDLQVKCKFHFKDEYVLANLIDDFKTICILRNKHHSLCHASYKDVEY